MAPIKFEEQLKEKLEQRSIQPSSDAWEKLSDRLDEVDDKQNNKGFWWLGIAATIVGVLIALTFVFKSNTEIVDPTIVDTKKENVIETNKGILKENNTLVAEQKDETKSDKIEQVETKNKINKAPLRTVIKQKQEAIIPKNVDEAVADINSNKGITKKAVEVLSFEDQKVKDVVVKIQQLQQENKEVSAEEIDALLASAQKEITMQKLYNEATNKVDANALLQSVEDDLEQSFRNKVFEAIKSGYETVKTAVAERNN